MQNIWAKVKTAGQWVWNWITVITAALLGVPDLVLGLLDLVTGLDISPLVGPATAIKIISVVAIVKALLTLYVTGGKIEKA